MLLARPITFPVGVMVLYLSVACATTAPRPSGQPADAMTTQRVRAALAADPILAGRQIEVSVQNGVVHLSGFVESTHDLLVVQADAKSVRGVMSVDEEQLAIVRGGSPP
jgi:osmotically-inducible protein OsmY